MDHKNTTMEPAPEDTLHPTTEHSLSHFPLVFQPKNRDAPLTRSHTSSPASSLLLSVRARSQKKPIIAHCPFQHRPLGRRRVAITCSTRKKWRGDQGLIGYFFLYTPFTLFMKLTGPVLVVTVPEIRKSQGYVSPARIPDTYPCKPIDHGQRCCLLGTTIF